MIGEDDDNSDTFSRSRTFSSVNRFLLEGPAYRVTEFIGIYRFRDVVEGTELEGFHGGIHRRERGQDDDRTFRIDLVQSTLQSDPVHPGHFQIHDHQVERS